MVDNTAPKNPSWIQQLLINAILPTLENFGESFLVQTFQKIHDANPTAFPVKLKTLHDALLWLEPEVIKTPTSIDDGLIDTIQKAITASAVLNNVTL